MIDREVRLLELVAAIVAAVGGTDSYRLSQQRATLGQGTEAQQKVSCLDSHHSPTADHLEIYCHDHYRPLVRIRNPFRAEDEKKRPSATLHRYSYPVHRHIDDCWRAGIATMTRADVDHHTARVRNRNHQLVVAVDDDSLDHCSNATAVVARHPDTENGDVVDYEELDPWGVKRVLLAPAPVHANVVDDMNDEAVVVVDTCTDPQEEEVWSVLASASEPESAGEPVTDASASVMIVGTDDLTSDAYGAKRLPMTWTVTELKNTHRGESRKKKQCEEVLILELAQMTVWEEV